MSTGASEPEVPLPGVRTPLRGDAGGATLCPTCRRAPLRGQQTVCSPRCRVRRHRERRDAARRARDREIRGLLEAALRKLVEGGEQ